MVQSSASIPGNEADEISVVLADSDPRVRRALRALIESGPGISVIGEAAAAAEVLAYSRTNPRAVILLDLLFPSLEQGLSLLRQLAGEQQWAVIAMSVRGGLREAALRAGACAFVEKGATPEVILQAIQSAALTLQH